MSEAARTVDVARQTGRAGSTGARTRDPGPGTYRRPAQSRVRIHEVDALRGFALLGIVLVNAQAMAGPYGDFGGNPSAAGADDAVAWLVTALAGMKFYVLFAFLFGYSCTLQRSSAQRGQARFVPRQLRRLLGLFVLGLAHATLLYVGDILVTYALLGLVLLACGNLTPRVAAVLAGVLVAALGALLLIGGAVLVVLNAPQDTGTSAAEVAGRVAAYRGGPASVVRANLEELPLMLASGLLLAADVLAAMLLGQAAGKRGLLERPVRAGRWAPLLWGVGLSGGVFLACCQNGPLPGRWYWLGTAVGVLTAPALTAAYASGLLAVLRTASLGGRLGRLLAPAGRMALTNYLCQSLALALVFTGYGLGLYGRLGTAAVAAVALLLYAAQLACSAWLMSRFRYGPAEWLLRALTLARLPSGGPGRP